jgi:hypothetical protein
VLFYRRGKRQKLTALYDLEPSVKVKKESTVIAPTVETVQRSFDRIFEKNLANAVRTAKIDGPTLEARGRLIGFD